MVLHANTSSAELQQAAFDFDNVRPGSVLALQADLRDADALPDLVEQAVTHFGRLDALVNNASNFFPTPLGQVTAEAMDALYAVNARAPLLLSQAAAPYLRRQQGCIVNLTDLHGTDPMRDHIAYTMAKAALEMATRALALELAPKVRVNAVAPGAILWPEQGRTISPARRCWRARRWRGSARSRDRRSGLLAGGRSQLRHRPHPARGWWAHRQLKSCRPAAGTRRAGPCPASAAATTTHHSRSTTSNASPNCACARHSVARSCPLTGSMKPGAMSASGFSTKACFSSGRGMRRWPGPSTTRSP